jgi:hypothetical protein
VFHPGREKPYKSITSNLSFQGTLNLATSESNSLMYANIEELLQSKWKTRPALLYGRFEYFTLYSTE